VRDPNDENSQLLKKIISDAAPSTSELIKAELVQLELGNLQDVQAAAQKIAERINARELPPITHLVAQAGTQFQTSTLHWSKEQPICELTFGVNHLAHALLCLSLLPVLNPRARIITFSSSSHDPAAGWGIPVAYRPVEEMAAPGESEADIPRGGLSRCECRNLPK